MWKIFLLCSNFIDSQSDCCSSLSAANNLDSFSPPRMDSLQQHELKALQLNQDTISSSVDHARRQRALELQYERRRKTLEVRRKSCQGELYRYRNLLQKVSNLYFLPSRRHGWAHAATGSTAAATIAAATTATCRHFRQSFLLGHRADDTQEYYERAPDDVTQCGFSWTQTGVRWRRRCLRHEPFGTVAAAASHLGERHIDASSSSHSDRRWASALIQESREVHKADTGHILLEWRWLWGWWAGDAFTVATESRQTRRYACTEDTLSSAAPGGLCKWRKRESVPSSWNMITL